MGRRQAEDRQVALEQAIALQERKRGAVVIKLREKCRERGERSTRRTNAAVAQNRLRKALVGDKMTAEKKWQGDLDVHVERVGCGADVRLEQLRLNRLARIAKASRLEAQERYCGQGRRDKVLRQERERRTMLRQRADATGTVRVSGDQQSRARVSRTMREARRKAQELAMQARIGDHAGAIPRARDEPRGQTVLAAREEQQQEAARVRIKMRQIKREREAAILRAPKVFGLRRAREVWYTRDELMQVKGRA
jgi:hypothetical protein